MLAPAAFNGVDDGTLATARRRRQPFRQAPKFCFPVDAVCVAACSRCSLVPGRCSCDFRLDACVFRVVWRVGGERTLLEAAEIASGVIGGKTPDGGCDRSRRPRAGDGAVRAPVSAFRDRCFRRSRRCCSSAHLTVCSVSSYFKITKRWCLLSFPSPCQRPRLSGAGRGAGRRGGARAQ